VEEKRANANANAEERLENAAKRRKLANANIKKGTAKRVKNKNLR